jgi:diguanylate cyclase
MEQGSQNTESLEWVLDIFRSIDVGVVIVEPDYKIRLWNSWMVNHSGISAQEILNQNLFERFPYMPEKWLKQKIDSVFKLNTRSYINWEQHPYIFHFKNYRPITGTADYMYQNVTVIPLHSGSGEVTHVGLIVYDVTDFAVSQGELESANQMLAQLSRTDKLTQLFNRGHWEERLHLEYERSKRSGQSCALVMFDIDHFKKVNDTYGHQAGDAVIRRTAQTLIHTIRQTDIAGRYGGEEFGVILTGTEAQTALYFTERLRKKIEEQTVSYEGQDIKYTISLGIAELSADMSTYQEWLEASDTALYDAKHGGRNRSSIFNKKAS